jgi:hypothetical protein
VNRSTPNSEMSSSTEKSSTPSKSFACWLNAGVHYITVRPHSSLGYEPPAPETWMTPTGKGHGEVETASRFPLLHTPDGGYLNSEINALH